MRPTGAAGIVFAFAATLLAQDGTALFQKHCSYCHGARGEGGRGPDLTTGRYKHAQSDDDLFLVIRNGVRGTEMPAVRATEAEVRQIVAHVRSLATAAVRDGVARGGDAKAGVAVFEAHCARCHPDLGPDLRFTAQWRGAEFVRESILKPEAEIAAGYRAVRIELKGRSAVAGIRLNEDDLSVQIRDESGALRSFAKAGIAAIDRTKPSLMPSFAGGRLSAKELEDVIAYLLEPPR